MEPPAPTRKEVVTALSLNVCAAVGTIFINKLIFQKFEFSFGNTLTVCHFYITFAFTAVCAALKVFKVKKLQLIKVLPISLSFCGYVVFNNISLLFNSVSFYQVMKIFCTPVILGIEYFFYGKSTDKMIILTLIPVCVGIFISVFTDMELNVTGTIFAVLAIISNSLYTIWGKRKVKALEAGPLQVLLFNSLMSAIILTFTIPVFDNMSDLIKYTKEDISFWGVFWILASCVSAFFVNFSFFLLVGKTSPLTVNMVGYFKTCVVFFGGIVLFQSEYNLKNISGIVLTLVGLLFYTIVKVRIQEKASKNSTILPIVEGEEKDDDFPVIEKVPPAEK